MYDFNVFQGLRFNVKDYGFAAINVKWNQLSIEYWNDQGKQLWEPIIVPKVDMMQECAAPASNSSRFWIYTCLCRRHSPA